MAKEVFTNNAVSTLAADIVAADTDLDVQVGDGALFPSLSGGDWFYATMVGNGNVEVVKVTARTTDTLTIDRAEQGTSAFDWPAGTEISHRITATTLTGLQQTLEKGAASGYAGLGSDALIEQDQLQNILWYFGTQTDPGVIGDWTARGTAFDSTSSSPNGVFGHKNALAGNNVAMYTQGVPGGGGAFTVEFAIIPHMFNVATVGIGACLYESATGKIITLGWERPGGFIVNKYTNNTTYASTYLFESVGSLPILFLRIKRDGSSQYVFGVSWDGVNYMDMVTSAINNFFTTAADEIGFFVNANNASRAAAIRVLSVKGL